MDSKTTTMDSVASFKRAPRDIQDLEFLDKLGNGLFGVVWKARNVYSGEVVAVKKFNSSNVASKLEFLKEAKIIKTLRHENLLRFLAMFVVQDDRLACGAGLYLVTEFCEGGDLAKRLADDSHPLAWRDRVRFALDIARGLQHLHKNHVIHRDLKCENCLLYPDRLPLPRTTSMASNATEELSSHATRRSSREGGGKSAGEEGGIIQPRVVLADFGLSRWHTSLDGSSDQPSKMTVCGTPYTMAPEIMDVHSGARYSSSCDIFSFGVVLCEIATRSRAVDLPRSDDMGVDVRGVARMIAPNEFGDHAGTREYVFLKSAVLALVRKCCIVVPSKRPTVSSVVGELESMLETIMHRGGAMAGEIDAGLTGGFAEGLDKTSSSSIASMEETGSLLLLSTVAEDSKSSTSQGHHKSKSKSRRSKSKRNSKDR